MLFNVETKNYNRCLFDTYTVLCSFVLMFVQNIAVTIQQSNFFRTALKWFARVSKRSPCKLNAIFLNDCCPYHQMLRKDNNQVTVHFIREYKELLYLDQR